jgi:hypothetical protein
MSSWWSSNPRGTGRAYVVLGLRAISTGAGCICVEQAGGCARADRRGNTVPCALRADLAAVLLAMPDDLARARGHVPQPCPRPRPGCGQPRPHAQAAAHGSPASACEPPSTCVRAPPKLRARFPSLRARFLALRAGCRAAPKEAFRAIREGREKKFGRIMADLGVVVSINQMRAAKSQASPGPERAARSVGTNPCPQREEAKR